MQGLSHTVISTTTVSILGPDGFVAGKGDKIYGGKNRMVRRRTGEPKTQKARDGPSSQQEN